MTLNEFNRVTMEANMAEMEEAYFAARPQIDSIDRRRVFEAGFQRAWERAITAAERAQAVTVNADQCTKNLQAAGKAYPRTCTVCGLGPCFF